MTDGDRTNDTPGDDQNPSGPQANPSGSPKNGQKASNATDPTETLANVLGGFSKMSAGSQDGVSPQITDALTQALLAILGAGPSIAAFDSLLSVQAANGMMYYNAVAHQQKANMLGMAMTAKCVRYMLDPSSNDLDGWSGDDE